MRIGDEVDLAEGIGALGPRLDHVVVVNGAADDASDAMPAHLAGVGNEARQMRRVAGGGERPGDSKEDDPPVAQNLVRRSVLDAFGVDEFHRYRRYPVTRLNHAFFCPLP